MLDSEPRNELTILVLTYNGSHWLRTCLPSLEGAGKVLVIDNGSQEDIAAVAADYSFVEQVIRFEQNQGFAGAYNLAVREVTTPFVALLSNDTIAKPNCFVNLLSVMKRDDRIGLVGPLLLNVDGSVQECGYDMDFFGFPISMPFSPSITNRRSFYVSGCLLVLRTAVFRLIGGFSTHLEFFVEDVDLCWKVWLSGFSVQVIPSAHLIHHGGGTLEGASTSSSTNITSTRRTYFRERNVPLVFLQNFALPRIFFFVPLFAINSAMEAAGLTISGKWQLAKQYLLAWRDFFRLLPAALATRSRVQNMRVVGDSAVLPFFKRRHRKAELILKNGFPKVAS